MFKTKINSSSLRHGLSLIEIMIAMVMTLIVLGAMMAAFSYGSAEMQKGRASIELNNRLISAEAQLRRDLDRVTVELKPHQQLPALPKGYIEIVDGPQTDYVTSNDPDGRVALGLPPFAHGGDQMIFGDRDDYFACTIKSDGKAFRGRLGNEIVESHLAEVVWFTVFDSSTPDTDDVLLVRRQLLILPAATIPAGSTYDTFLQNNDISVRRTVGGLVPNSITDLAIRGNRYSHSGAGAADPAFSMLEILELGTRYNDNHVMVSSLAAFDVQAFANDASVLVIPDTTGGIRDIGEPSDIGSQKGAYAAGNYSAIAGAYVDLGKGSGLLGGPSSGYLFGYNSTNGALSNPPASGTLQYESYDTGTSQYNRNSANDSGSNGIDDDGDGLIDEADIDANGDGTIDATPAEQGELDASPPYNAPIRGLKFTMRVLEPNTKQVRQLTVKKSFVAQ